MEKAGDDDTDEATALLTFAMRSSINQSIDRSIDQPTSHTVSQTMWILDLEAAPNGSYSHADSFQLLLSQPLAMRSDPDHIRSVHCQVLILYFFHSWTDLWPPSLKVNYNYNCNYNYYYYYYNYDYNNNNYY